MNIYYPKLKVAMFINLSLGIFGVERLVIPESIFIFNILLGTFLPFTFAKQFLIRTFKVNQALSMLILAFICGLLGLFSARSNTSVSTIFAFHVQLNAMSYLIELAVIAFAIVTLIIVSSYFIRKFETILLILAGLLGAMFMIIAGDLLVAYLGLELLSISTYILLASMTTIRSSVEAGIKYLLFSALSSGFVLLGIAIIYATIGTTTVAYSGLFSDFVLLYPSFTIANLFILIGLSFKLGLFPFHSWVPDVYQGAPLYSIVFLILIPKIAYISFIVTLILQFRGTWQFIPLTYLGIFSIIFSGVAAINQTYILRLLGYSTINNIGISVLPLAIGSMDGIVVTGVYLGIYLLLNAVVFSILGLCPILSLYDMSSLVVYPFLGLCFTLTMFSNAGIPPLVGFFGKYCVIASLFGNRGYFSGIIVIITSAISAFFYIRLISYLFFMEAKMVLSLSRRYTSTLIVSFSFLNLFGMAFIGLILNKTLINSLLRDLWNMKINTNYISCVTI